MSFLASSIVQQHKTMLKQTHLYQEIHQQSAVIDHFLSRSMPDVAQLAGEMQKRTITHVTIAARGTSDNAGRYAKYALGAYNHLPVSLATPSLYSQYKMPPRLQDGLALGISQSGQSPDIVAVLAEAKKQGALTAAITNEPQSPLAQVSDVVIELHAGNEQAVAATKTYTASLAAVAAFSAKLEEDAGRLADLIEMPAKMEQTLAMGDAIAGIAPRYRYMKHCVVIGRGFNYATAFETALKLKELTYTVVEPYSSADFLHGPLALIEEGFPALVIAPSGVLAEEMEAFVQTLQNRGAEVVGISDNAGILAASDFPLQMPAIVPEWLSPLTAIVAGQLFALHLTAIKGYNVDAPRNIQKVTETM